MARAAVVRGAERFDVWQYPILAVREAIVNALVHRDYSSGALGAQVQIELFPDRLTIRNPGGLHGPVDPSRLPDLPVSATRNPYLLRILEDVPLDEGGVVCENRGSGLLLINEVLEGDGHPPAEYADSLSVFQITLRPRVTRPRMALGGASPEDEGRRLIVRELRAGPLSLRDLGERTGLSRHVLRRRLNALRTDGVVQLLGGQRDPNAKWGLTTSA